MPVCSALGLTFYGSQLDRALVLFERALERALALDVHCGSLPVNQRPLTRLGMCMLAGDIDRSRALLAEVAASAASAGTAESRSRCTTGRSQRTPSGLERELTTLKAAT